MLEFYKLFQLVQKLLFLGKILIISKYHDVHVFMDII